jgi:hypothetical protein
MPERAENPKVFGVVAGEVWGGEETVAEVVVAGNGNRKNCYTFLTSSETRCFFFVVHL